MLIMVGFVLSTHSDTSQAINNIAQTVDQLLVWLDLAGVAVFAISGALVASRKCLDPVGFALIATVTGIGGGTLRDLLLGLPVFWVGQPHYVGLCVAMSLIVFFAAPFVEYRYRVLLWADAIGLSLFSVLGAKLAVVSGFGITISVLMGLSTATFGGLIRDVLCSEIPLILRREIYATAALSGALVYACLTEFAQLPYMLPEFCGVLTCFAVRALGLISGLSLPAYRARAGRDYPAE